MSEILKKYDSLLLIVLALTTFVLIKVAPTRLYVAGDSQESLVTTQSILQNKTIRLDAYYPEDRPNTVAEERGRLYYNFPLGTPLLSLPFVGVQLLRGKDMLDFGCGSGILALAAMKLGAAQAVGVDNDPQALLASRDNADRNGVGERLDVYLPEQEPVRQYPIVAANILASALIQLVELLAARVQPGGVIALSGILHNQADEVLNAYSRYFDALEVTRLEDWVRINGRRG